MDIRLKTKEERNHFITPDAPVGTSFWRVAGAVFTGLWLFTISASIVVAILHSTGDLRW